MMISVISLVFMSSSIMPGGREARVGEEAPDFKVENPYESFRLSEATGKKVTVNFWSVHDPESRMRNARLARLHRDAHRDYVGICVDSDRQLALEVIRQDGLEPERQFMLADVKKGNPARDYETSTGLRTFTVNSYGNLEAVSAD